MSSVTKEELVRSSTICVRIKLCGIRSVRDAVFCARAGADELGVVFAKKSKRCVSIETARAIREAVPEPIPLVGVFQDATALELVEAIRGANLSAVQLHGSRPDDLFAPEMLTRLGVPVYVALQMTGNQSFTHLSDLPPASRLLLDGPSGGSGASFSWSLARDARAGFAGQIFVAGGLNPTNVADAIRAAAPDGVDVSSGIEGADGFKDEARVAAFVKAARAAEIV